MTSTEIRIAINIFLEIKKHGEECHFVKNPKDSATASQLYIKLREAVKKYEFQDLLRDLEASNRIPRNQEDYTHLVENIKAVASGAITNFNLVSPQNQLTKKKLFISHAYLDRVMLTEAFLDSQFLELIGLTHEDVFYTSFLPTSIGLDKRWREEIKNNLLGAEVVLFL